MSESQRVFIGLGANLSNPIAQLQNAIAALNSIPKTQLIKTSSLYGSKPLGPADQPDYVNAVAELATKLVPENLLDYLQRIENEQGRARKAERWGPRTLDLDIILFGDQVINTPRLTIPHYHFQHREFVLYPLAEIASDLVFPDGGTLQIALQKVDRNGLERLNIAQYQGNS